MKDSTQWADHFAFMPRLNIWHRPQARKLSEKERESQAIKRMLKESNQGVKSE